MRPYSVALRAQRIKTGFKLSITVVIFAGAFIRFLNPWVTMIRRSWMTGASIETTLELWASSLREVKKRIRPLFAQDRAALNAGLFVDGLLGDERRKTGWMRAEAAGDPGPWRQQAVLGRDRWDADALRDLVRDYATEHLADENAVLQRVPGGVNRDSQNGPEERV